MNKKIGFMELTESLKELNSALFIIMSSIENISETESRALYAVWRSLGNVADELQEEIENI